MLGISAFKGQNIFWEDQHLLLWLEPPQSSLTQRTLGDTYTQWWPRKGRDSSLSSTVALIAHSGAAAAAVPLSASLPPLPLLLLLRLLLLLWLSLGSSNNDVLARFPRELLASTVVVGLLFNQQPSLLVAQCCLLFEFEKKNKKVLKFWSEN